ncbi:hypothetical protein [Paenibacillus mendelii]|uniref:Uncharacterized protein n=1 Tax=Paenibacillus mendelii TaxID=206163 RepID=A0ABV6JF79_9BACL|nr:hypothetical protein [Paenibacillus mendelii]
MLSVGFWSVQQQTRVLPVPWLLDTIVNKLVEEAVRTGVTICHNKNVIEISHEGAVRHILFNNGDGK